MLDLVFGFRREELGGKKNENGREKKSLREKVELLKTRSD